MMNDVVFPFFVFFSLQRANEKPDPCDDRRHFIPLEDHDGFLHDASSQLAISHAAVACVSHGHTDHGAKLASAGMAQAMREGHIKVVCPVHLEKLMNTLTLDGHQTMASVLRMGRLPLEHVHGINYEEEVEVPGAAGVKMVLLPARHCPGDSVTMLLDTNTSPPTAHILTGDLCAEDELINAVKSVMENWRVDYKFIATGFVSMDALRCWRRTYSSRESEAVRMENIVRTMKGDS